MSLPFSPLARFAGRNMVMASSNGKEVVLGPLLCELLNVSLVIDAEFKSDLIRENSAKDNETPLRLMRNKLLHALSISGESLGIGTEAFFVTHPKYTWIAVHTEMAMLVDLETNTEAFYSIISLQTNYKAASVRTIQELIDFAEQIGFPSHGVRLSSGYASSQAITDLGSLINHAFQHGLPDQPVHVETDIRIRYNPTRRRIVGLSVEQLLKSLASTSNHHISGYGFVCRCGKFKNLDSVDGFDFFCIRCESLN